MAINGYDPTEAHGAPFSQPTVARERGPGTIVRNGRQTPIGLPARLDQDKLDRLGSVCVGEHLILRGRLSSGQRHMLAVLLLDGALVPATRPEPGDCCSLCQRRQDGVVEWPGGLRYEPILRDLTMHGRRLGLTRTEEALVRELARSLDAVVTARVLLLAAWPSEWLDVGSERQHAHILRVNFSRIRAKLNAVGYDGRRLIESRNGIGYRLTGGTRLLLAEDGRAEAAG